MSLVTQTLSCTGTGSPTLVRSPATIKSATGTSIPKVVKLPSRSLQATGTIVPKLLNRPGRILMATATNSVIITLLAFGIDTFDIFEGKRKWIVNGVNRIQLNVKKRFTFLVRGKPYG